MKRRHTQSSLMPIRTSLIDVTSIRFGKLDAFFDLSEEHDAKHEYCVAWVDCASRGPALGRGIFMAGDHAMHGSLDVQPRRVRRVPFTPPVSLINGLTLRAFNELYYRKQRKPVERSRVGYDGYFYPLDSLLEWNRIYGPPGFQQYQCVVPAASARDAVRAMLDRIPASGTGSFLAVLKRCGNIPSPGCCRFRWKARRSRSIFRSTRCATAISSPRSIRSCATPADASIRPRTHTCRAPISAPPILAGSSSNRSAIRRCCRTSGNE